MNLEEEVFQNFTANNEKLIIYSFLPNQNKLIYKKRILNNGLEAVIEYSNKIKG